MVLIFESETERSRFDEWAYDRRPDMDVFGFFERLPFYKEEPFKVLRFAKREGLVTREDGRLILVYYGIE